MINIKSYKKAKNNHHRFINNGVIIVGIITVAVALFYSNRTTSEDINHNKNVENIIENTCNFVVGVSKENNIINDNDSTWGSGIIVSKSGLILTNAHVCGEKNSTCYVIFDYQKEYEGRVVWSNENWDIAIIKINVGLNECISFHENNNLKLGQEVYSIGNPINISFQKTVSKGIISGLNRYLKFEENGEKYYMSNLIQTDAAINRGCSGGALIDEDGNLIGINTIKISDAELMSFSIPIDIIIPVIKKLENNLNFEEANLKIWCYDKYNIYESGIRNKIDNGVMVAKIENNSNAEKAGLRVGDIINYVDTDEIKSVLDLKKVLLDKNVGENIILKINRNNTELLLNVVLE